MRSTLSALSSATIHLYSYSEKEGEIEKEAATTTDVYVTSFNSMDPDDTLSVPSEVSEQQQPLANSTAVEEIDKDIENGLLGAEQTDCKTTEDKE